jgi:hypothetical protein
MVAASVEGGGVRAEDPEPVPGPEPPLPPPEPSPFPQPFPGPFPEPPEPLEEVDTS